MNHQPDSAEISEVGDERRRGEESFAEAVGHLAEADHLDMYDAKELHHLAWAQMQTLRAIYHELRHGHDLQDVHTRTIRKQTAAIEEMTHVMHRLWKRLGSQ